jgi:hypothetical protein
MRTIGSVLGFVAVVVIIAALSVNIAFGAPLNAIEQAMGRPANGGVVVLDPGTYRVSKLIVKPNIILYALKGATIIGDLMVRGPNAVIRGLSFVGGSIDMSNSQAVTVGDCRFTGGETAINLNDSVNALIINNDFESVAGGSIMGWESIAQPSPAITSAIAVSASPSTSRTTPPTAEASSATSSSAHAACRSKSARSALTYTATTSSTPPSPPFSTIRSVQVVSPPT